MSKIPIIINNFNRLTTTRKLVDDLIRLGYTNIHIIDNGSTYPPLLDWYREIDGNGWMRVFYAGVSHNQLALWNTGYIERFKDESYIVYTDSDVELNFNTPHKFIEELILISRTHNGVKAGLALKIDDLPKTKMGNRVRTHEAQFWKELFGGLGNIYGADIDTTFAVIKPTDPFTYKAVRVGGNFTARHIPWYTDFGNLSEEEKYILDHTNGAISTYRRDYNNYLEIISKQKVNI